MSRKVLFVHDGPLYINEKKEVFGVHYTERIKERYLRLGDKVTFCMREKKIINSENNYSRISSKNFQFIPFPNFKSISTYFPNKSKAVKIITEIIKCHDVLIVRMPSASGSIAIKAAREHHVPYLVEMVACTYDAYNYYDWKGKLIAPFKLNKVRDIIKDCPYVLYVTKSFLQERYPSKGITIHCSDVRLKANSQEVLQDRILKIKSGLNPLVVGSIGTVDVKYKGQADVIKALHLLKKNNLIFNYKIVGQGNPERLQCLINELKMEDEVEIVGSIPSSKINDFLKSIDLYIHPSYTEGLPRALIEGMSMACPAFGSKVGGIPELLLQDCLFEAGNISEIVRLLESITPERMLKEAKRNFEAAKQYETSILEQRRDEFYNLFLKNSFGDNNTKI